jgi:hypothetical protein
MTPERWRQIDKLVEAALELDTSQRKAFLNEACAGDESLRWEVESLLAANEQARERDFIGVPAVVDFTELLVPDQSPKNMAGKFMILNDRYSLEIELGRGAIGIVYLARDLKGF